MFKSYIYIIIFLVFIVSGILIGWSLTFSDQFNHIDSKSQQKKIIWWKVCIVAICCALILSLFIFIGYKIYYKEITFNKNSETPWINDWNPDKSATQTTISPPREYDYPVKYPGIPLMEPKGIF